MDTDGAHLWDDLLDEFEDMVDEVQTALDYGHWPDEITPPSRAERLPGPPNGTQRLRLQELRARAEEQSARIQRALAAHESELSRQADRRRAARSYASHGSRRGPTSGA